jgi:hypothetical protein
LTVGHWLSHRLAKAHRIFWVNRRLLNPQISEEFAWKEMLLLQGNVAWFQLKFIQDAFSANFSANDFKRSVGVSNFPRQLAALVEVPVFL